MQKIIETIHTVMLKIISIVVLMTIISVINYSQTIAPINWQRYKVGQQNISLLFPKLPVMIEGSNVCNEQSYKNYAVYADGVVYGLKIVTKFEPNKNTSCDKPQKFNENSFLNYLNDLKMTFPEAKSLMADDKFIKLSNNGTTHWLLNDYSKKRWFDFWVVGASEEKKEVASFLASLSLKTNEKDIEIGYGAEAIIGDEITENVPGQTESSLLVIVLKPRPNYPEAARQIDVQGTVTLRVTFLSNGAIGAITPVSGLPYGFTEECIKVAKKIVFIPTRKNGVFTTVTKTLQYSFTMY